MAVPPLVPLRERRVGLEVGAGQVVEQHIEGGVEEIAPAPDQMVEDRLLVGEQPVMAAVELVAFRQAGILAQQIGERTAVEPVAMQPPLAARREQAIGHQHEQDQIPARALAVGGQPVCPEAIESKLLPQRQGEPAAAPLPRPAEPHLRELEADHGVVRRQALAAILGKQRDAARSRRSGLHDFDRASPGQLLGIIDLAKIQHLLLDRSAAGDTAVFHDTPVSVFLTVLPARFEAQEHDVEDYPRNGECWKRGRSAPQTISGVLATPRTAKSMTCQSEIRGNFYFGG